MLADERDEARVLATVVGVSLLAWLALIFASRAVHIHGAAGAAAQWAVMLAAMMGPVVVAPLQVLRARSFRRRRGRTTALFVVGYGGVWMAAGVGLGVLGPMVGLAAAVGMAVVWQCSPWKQVCLNRCHRLPETAAFGRAADVDALRAGAAHGGWCVGSCWALMVVPMLLPAGHLAGMAAVGVVMVSERLEGPGARRWRWRGTGFSKYLKLVVNKLEKRRIIKKMICFKASRT